MTIPFPKETSTTLRLPPKALIVGRTGADAAALNAQLQQEGYFVYTAAQTTEALARLRADKFELVLLCHPERSEGPTFDLESRSLAALGMTSFIQALRADPTLAQLPVIVLSESNDVAVVEQCLAAGADDALTGAFGPSMLHVRVNAAIDRRGSRDHENMRREMDVARKIQRDFLPETLPVAPDVQLDAALHPARQVSGDFYDAFQLAPSGNIVLVVGDVCDKGVGAALFMALFRSLIRASADPVGAGAIQMIGGRRTLVVQSLESATAGDLLTRVAGFTNNYIARIHGRTNMFATVFMAVLDPVYGALDYVNAGHEPALIIGKDGAIQELRPTGPALGMMPDSVFKAGEAQLLSGQGLLAFTDGVAEAHSPSGEVFGGERLREVLRANRGAAAPALVRGVVDAVKAFAGQAEPHDDLTMLAATRR